MLCLHNYMKQQLCFIFATVLLDVARPQIASKTHRSLHFKFSHRCRRLPTTGLIGKQQVAAVGSHKQLALMLLHLSGVELQYTPTPEHHCERRPVDCSRAL